MQLSTLLADLGGRGWHPGTLLFGVLVPLAILGLVVYGIWELASSRRLAPAGPSAGPAPSTVALAVLDERFARGEIDAEDFVQRRTLLTSPTAPPTAPEATNEQPATPDPEAPAV